MKHKLESRFPGPVQKESGELIPAKPHGPCGQGGGLKDPKIVNGVLFQFYLLYEPEALL